MNKGEVNKGVKTHMAGRDFMYGWKQNAPHTTDENGARESLFLTPLTAVSERLIYRFNERTFGPRARS